MFPHFAGFPGTDTVPEYPRGERQRGLAVPGDLCAGRSIVLAVQVAAHRRHEAECLSEVLGGRQLADAREVRQQCQFDLGECGCGRKLRLGSGQVREGGDAPGDHRVDCHRPFDAHAGSMSDRLHLASRFQDPVPILDPPPQAVEPDHLASLVQAGDRQCREQDPGNWLRSVIGDTTSRT